MIETAVRARRRPVLLWPAAGLLLLAAACTTGPPAADDAAVTGSADVGPVSVIDVRGEAVELDGPAVDVVALEWGLAENLVALGVQPVGAVDVAGYTTWDEVAPLEDGVVDVGVRQEPSVDAVTGLDPDLVVATDDLDATTIARIEDAGVPVLVLAGSDAADPLGAMETTVTTLAEVTGTPDQGERLLSDLADAVAEGAAEIDEAGLTGTAFVMADGWDDSGTVSVRVYTGGAMLTAVGEELGLVNAWAGEGDPVYGLAPTDVDALAQLPADAAFLYIHTNTAVDPFAGSLAEDPAWTSLPFVEAGAVHRLPDGVWMFGGPLSAAQFVDAAVEALT